MIRIGIIIFTSLCSASLAVPPGRLRHGSDDIKMERINYLLRNKGMIIRGPLILPDIPNGASHLDAGLQPPIEESYNFYLPPFNFDYDEKPPQQKEILTEISPPQITNEPNYYSRKQRKYPKKYSSTLKQVNIKPIVDNSYEPSMNIKKVREEPEIIFDDDYFGSSIQMPVSTKSSRRHASPKSYTLEPEIEERTVNNDVENVEGKFSLPPNNENVRIEYQIHGFDGPKSYKFGYDTGTKGKERHFRFEERNNQGEVKGEYGYHDKEGKIRIVKYTSDAEKGFQVDKTP